MMVEIRGYWFWGFRTRGVIVKIFMDFSKLAAVV
jgi:hypothetical protein